MKLENPMKIQRIAVESPPPQQREAHGGGGDRRGGGGNRGGPRPPRASASTDGKTRSFGPGMSTPEQLYLLRTMWYM